MKKTLVILFLLLTIISAQTIKKQIEIPAIFSDNMVLQQKSVITIWGKAEPQSKIVISSSWGGKANTSAKDDRSWSAKIKTPKAGGPYVMNLKVGDSTITFKNILIGEVWLCSGQSNMEMPLAGWPPRDTINNSGAEISSADLPNLRLFTVTRAYSVIPASNVKGTWQQCSPQTVPSFSATAFFFGKKLLNELKIPIGLIHSSWGGTPVEAWIGIKKISAVPAYKSIIDNYANSEEEFNNLVNWLNSHRIIDLSSNNDDSKWQNLNFDDAGCSMASYDDSKWDEMILPVMWERTKLGNFDGSVWFRKKIEIPETWLNKNLVLELGPIDDMDVTFVNGLQIGAIEGPGFWQKDRIYDIPDSLIKEKNITVAVRVVDTQGGGGIYGAIEKMKISLKNSSESISISGAWKYLPVAEYLAGKFYLFNPDQQEYSNRPKTTVEISANSPTTLYNAMITPLVPYKIKGAIWYQGESNTYDPDGYKILFPMMIKNWREDWKEDFSFYFTQIAPYRYGEGTNSQKLREAQFQSMSVPKTGMAVTLDISNIDNIHPGNKKDVGERLAAWALNKDYGKKVVCSGPIYKSMKVEGNKILLSFGNVEKGLIIKERNGEHNFEIAGDDKIFKKADVQIVDKKMLICNSEIEKPVAVRYAWSDIMEGTLFNSAGLPSPSFRTDNW